MIKRILAAVGSVLVFFIFIFLFVVPGTSENANTLRGVLLWNLDLGQEGPIIYNADGSWILGYPQNMPVFDENGNDIKLEEIMHGTTVEIVHTGTIINTSLARIASPLSIHIIENTMFKPAVIYAALLWESEWDASGPIFLGETGHFNVWNIYDIPVLDILGNPINITDIIHDTQVEIWFYGEMLESYPAVITSPISIRVIE